MRDFNIIDFYIQKKRINLIKEYVPPDCYLLDIGCGYYPYNLKDLEHKIKKAVGIDKEPPEKYASSNISFIKHNIEKTLLFPSEEFDCITMLAILEHLEYPADIIQECYRILRPGGRIIITIPSNYSKPILELLAKLGLISKEEIYDHKYYFSKNKVESLLATAHFTKEISKTYNLLMNFLFVYKKVL